MGAGGKPDDTSQLQDIIELYGNDVLRYAYIYIGDREFAEDISQQVFIKVFKNINKFNKNSSIKTWLLRITINECKDVLKSKAYKKFKQELPIPEFLNDDKSVFENAEKDETNKEIMKEIQKLPDNYKNVILLKYYKDFSNSEIAQVLGITESSVRSKLSRGIDKLRHNLKGSNDLYE